MLTGIFASCTNTPDETQTTVADTKGDSTESESSVQKETTDSSAETTVATDGNGSDETTSDDSESVDSSLSTTTDTTVSDTAADTETDTESTEAETTVEETTVEDEQVEVTLPENSREAAMIENANKLANRVQTYFPTPDRTSFAFENQEMYLEYILSSAKDQQVGVLKNKNGHTYIENTMDVYVRMQNTGKTYYVSKSTIPTTANIYRFGYYYYEMRLEEQVFSNDVNISDEDRFRHNQVHATHDIDAKNWYYDDGVLYVKNNETAGDP